MEVRRRLTDIAQPGRLERAVYRYALQQQDVDILQFTVFA